MVTVALDLRLASYRGGGISRYARDLYTGLALQDEVTVVPLRASRDPDAEQGAIRLRTPPHHRFERRALGVELRLSGARIDVYHTPDFIVPARLHVPAIATVQDLAFLHWPEDLTAESLRYYRQLDHSARDTAAWITPSEWTATDLSTAYGISRESIHVIPLGIPLDLFSLPVPARDSRRSFILAVGTIEPRKRFDLLLDALEHTGDQIHLMVVGQPGWNTEAVQARLRLHPHVTWLRSAGDAELQRLYHEAIALALPSRAEGFGLTAVEAMAAGTPVISSGGGALLEVTGDAALTVERQSPESWAEAMLSVVTDTDLWERLSANGRSRAAEFSWDRTARETLAVYRSVASCGR